MVDLANVQAPIETANGLPNVCYINPAMYEREQTTLFRNSWVAVGFGKDIPHIGCVRPTNFAGIPMLVVRNHHSKINVFQNVCRHRGMILIDTAKQLRGPITCPYHAWSYDLDGKLCKTPHVGGPDVHLHDSVKHCNYPLYSLRAHLWHDIIFVNISGAAPEFNDYAANLIDRWGEFEQPIYHGGPDSSFGFELDCNWKLAVENYCESYHLPFIHPALNSYSRLEDHYNITDTPNFAGQGTLVYAPQISKDGRQFPIFDGLSAKWDTGAEYVALFPNVLLGVHRDHYFAIILKPEGPEKTTEQIELYYTKPLATTAEFADMRANNSAMWRTVFAQDIRVVEGMQKGRHSTEYDGGKFSPVMDGPTHHFHKWVATAI